MNPTKKNPTNTQFSYLPFLFYYGLFLYMELIVRANHAEQFLGMGLLYIFLFSIIPASLCAILTTLFKPLVNKILGALLCFLITVLYASQLVYHSVFSVYYTSFSLARSTQILDYYREAFTGIIENALPLLFLFLPFFFYVIMAKRLKLTVQNKPVFLLIIAIVTVFFHIMSLLFLLLSGKETLSPYDLYFNTSEMNASVSSLGLFTTVRLDAKRYLFDTGSKDEYVPTLGTGIPSISLPTPSGNDHLPDSISENAVSGNSVSSNDTLETPAVLIPKPQILEIDFDSFIASETDETLLTLHEYFKNATPTYTNEKTGLYEGYNLILITAEGFSPHAIHKDITPTLYKLANEGYVFENFYNPVWSVSTSDGEYVACTGLIPKSGVWSMSKSSVNSMPFTMGNQLKKLGYATNAYHNHSYTYYDRDSSHPNLGYDFKAVGNGLDIEPNWPESDLEMIDETVPEYVNKAPFHSYYMTVSGHMDYTFTGNYQAGKNKSMVKDLPYSDACKAYVACQIELDRAMGSLLKQLEAAGVLDNTLIALSADHYPYGLTNDEISEFVGHPVEDSFEKYKSTFILYTNNMEPEIVSKPCSSLDIIPTLSNLLGLPYDSRLLMGTDIFSDAPPLIIFSNRSFIAENYRFDFSNKEVTTPVGSKEIPTEEVRKIRKQIDDKFFVSAKILELDYYRKLGLE